MVSRAWDVDAHVEVNNTVCIVEENKFKKIKHDFRWGDVPNFLDTFNIPPALKDRIHRDTSKFVPRDKPSRDACGYSPTIVVLGVDYHYCYKSYNACLLPMILIKHA